MIIPLTVVRGWGSTEFRGTEAATLFWEISWYIGGGGGPLFLRLERRVVIGCALPFESRFCKSLADDKGIVTLQSRNSCVKRWIDHTRSWKRNVQKKERDKGTTNRYQNSGADSTKMGGIKERQIEFKTWLQPGEIWVNIRYSPTGSHTQKQ